MTQIYTEEEYFNKLKQKKKMMLGKLIRVNSQSLLVQDFLKTSTCQAGTIML